MDLSLHKKGPGIFVNETHEREAINRTRTWLICFNMYAPPLFFFYLKVLRGLVGYAGIESWRPSLGARGLFPRATLFDTRTSGGEDPSTTVD